MSKFFFILRVDFGIFARFWERSSCVIGLQRKIFCARPRRYMCSFFFFFLSLLVFDSPWPMMCYMFRSLRCSFPRFEKFFFIGSFEASLFQGTWDVFDLLGLCCALVHRDMSRTCNHRGSGSSQTNVHPFRRRTGFSRSSLGYNSGGLVLLSAPCVSAALAREEAMVAGGCADSLSYPLPLLFDGGRWVGFSPLDSFFPSFFIAFSPVVGFFPVSYRVVYTPPVSLPFVFSFLSFSPVLFEIMLADGRSTTSPLEEGSRKAKQSNGKEAKSKAEE
ncbi:hypothetical protein IWX46DRAFT_19214 [Phyllosticta citricarpa]|uniref:Transmembrane protein n=1 Tax=Phyllosticta citricarpa TaxID=55181 RepID=A0ABR1MQU1_9PEZI